MKAVVSLVSDVTMSTLPSVGMFREVQLVHETGYFSGQSSIDDNYQEVITATVTTD